jgi:hypothetical protein
MCWPYLLVSKTLKNGLIMKQNLKIIATANSLSLNEDDLSVSGEYLIEVPSNISDSVAASIALDVFHSNVPVRNLDDFEFEVYKNYLPISQASNWVDYSGSELGSVLY